MKTILHCVSTINDFKVINRTALLMDRFAALMDIGSNYTKRAVIAKLLVLANRAMNDYKMSNIQSQIVLFISQTQHLIETHCHNT